MAGRKKDPERTEATRNSLLENAYQLFINENIDSVSIGKVAKACGCSEMTVYRYYSAKPALVVAVATLKWRQFMEENRKRRPSADFSGMTAGQIFEFYLESFLEMYRKYRDLLRFNQFFNVYMSSADMDAETAVPYQKVIGGLREQFHDMCLKARQDHTLRTDVPEEEMFSATLHLMLAAVTRYAVGLVYDAGIDPEKELKLLKDMLMERFCVSK